MPSIQGSDHYPPPLAVHHPDHQSLLEQVHRLTNEVQRLIKVESKLYYVQQRVDQQVRHYHAMNEVGRQLSTSLDLQSVLNVIVEFILYKANLERCLILVADSENQYFHVKALDGYYEPAVYQKVAGLKIKTSQLDLAELNREISYDLCSALASTGPLVQLRPTWLMHEYVVFHLGENQDYAQCLLVAGNSQKMMPYQTRIEMESDLILCLTSLATHASTAIKKAIFYDTLQSQKQDLERALMTLNRKNLHLEQTLKALDEAHTKAIQDSLTGLFNRAYFDERFQQEFAQAQLNHEAIAITLLDLDFFKSINDSHGHLVGDLMLQQFGKLLQAQAPIGSIPCRYGGEEFAIILPNATPVRTYTQMDEIRRCFQIGRASCRERV